MDLQQAKYTENLLEKLREKVEDADRTIIEPFLVAFKRNEFHYIREDWHATANNSVFGEDTVPTSLSAPTGELLLRFKDEELKIESLAKILKHPVTCHLFDQLVATTAIEQAIQKKQFPVSINISSCYVSDETMLLDLHNHLREHFGKQFLPSDITFEFLEDDQGDNPSVLALNRLRGFGYKLAIDDLSHGIADKKRLKNLGPHVDIIKIDGKTLQSYRNGALSLEAFKGFLTEIKDIAPQAKILVEWVNDPQEVSDLKFQFHGLIDYVQGRELHGLSAATFSDALKDAEPLSLERLLMGPPKPADLS
jgi:EAL domain-containing protein (putative c-di-GMP-specific phosphodiesterase class I)